MRAFLTRLFQKAPVSEQESAAMRWKRINAEAKAAGCRCGRPGTHVRYYGPSAIWSCEEHQNVNQWSRAAGGTWLPIEMTKSERTELARWQTRVARPYTDVDKIRGGSGEYLDGGSE